MKVEFFTRKFSFWKNKYMVEQTFSTHQFCYQYIMDTGLKDIGSWNRVAQLGRGSSMSYGYNTVLGHNQRPPWESTNCLVRADASVSEQDIGQSLRSTFFTIEIVKSAGQSWERWIQVTEREICGFWYGRTLNRTLHSALTKAQA